MKLAAACLLVLMSISGSGVAAAPAATIIVTNAADFGAGSFRQAILDSNASVGVRDEITFNIPGSGVHTITLVSGLPEITDPVLISGASQPGYTFPFPLVELDGSSISAPNAVLTISAGTTEVYGLAINRGPDAGIRIKTNGSNTIGVCAIGTDSTGTVVLGNATHGVVIENVGGNTIYNGMNVISGNGMDGVLITGPLAIANSVKLNAIGTDWQGTASVGNGGFGVRIIDGSGNLVENNTIDHNGMGGVLVEGAVSGATVENNFIRANNGPGVAVLAPAAQVRIGGNAVADNTGLGIDLGNDGRTPNDVGDGDAGANNLQNFAELTAVRINNANGDIRFVNVEMKLRAQPFTTYTVVLFTAMPGASADHPRVIGAQYPQSISTDAAGNADLLLQSIQLGPGPWIFTAIVIDGAGNTSEFSPAIALPDLSVGSGCGLLGAEMVISVILAALARRRRGRGPSGISRR